MEVSRNMKILAKLASMNKEAQGNPMLVSSLIGAGAGGLAGDLTSQLLWKKPTKTQRILSALIGAGLGAGTGAAVTGSFGHKAVQNLPARLQSMYQNAVGTVSGKLPSKEDFASMSPTAKAMYGSTNTGDKAADRLGAVVNTIKKSVVGPEDEHKTLIGTLQGVAGGLSGVLGYKSSIKGMDRQGRRMQLIQALDAKAGTLPKGSQQRAILKRMRDNLQVFSIKNNPLNLAIRNFLDSSRFAKGRQLKRINETRKLISEDNANRRISNAARLNDLRNARAQADLNIQQENLRRLSLGKPELTAKQQDALRRKAQQSVSVPIMSDSQRKKLVEERRVAAAARKARARGASWRQSLFGLSADRAGELYDKNKLGLGFDTEHKAVDRNLVVSRPVGKMKRSAGIVAALVNALTAAGITGRIGNEAFGNNARYQQALTNLQNAYK